MEKNTKSQVRKKQDYLNLGRNFYENHYKAEASKTVKALEKVTDTQNDTASYKINQFLENNVKGWVFHYLKSRFGKKHPYQDYKNSDENGCYEIENENIKIACTADWASDTIESDQIGRKISNHEPEYTIHLGDTYFVGAPFEIENNFLNENCSWPRGSKGSFALLGNHEMYSRGVAYFEKLLPSLGLRLNGSGKFNGQKASFFCLENDYWRVIGLDTGYNSIGKIPILEKIFLPNCELPEELINWLKDDLRLSNDKRGLIFLSHHQYNSAFEHKYEVPAEQLAEIIGKERTSIWIWGHEHRLALYSKYNSKNGITTFGRCIGHGGMPTEVLNENDKPSQEQVLENKLVMYDNRLKGKVGNTKVGVNGYMTLKFQNENLIIEHFDLEKRIIKEDWEVNIGTGKLIGKSIQLEENSLEVVQNPNNALK